jgi:hypothetical protein
MLKRGKVPQMALILALTLALAGIAASAFAEPDMVILWDSAALDAIRTDNTAPPIASRNLAILTTSMFDAVNSIYQRYQPYRVNLTAAPDTSPEAAAASAGYTVLSSLFPTRNFTSLYNSSLASIPDGPGKTSGIALGQNVANQILTWRATDGWNAVYNYVPGTAPGQWRPTPPNNAPFLLPQWPEVKPLAMTSGSQMRQGPPPAMTSDAYTIAFNNVKNLGAATGSTRTADQTQIAYFWAGGSGTATPPGQWNVIAQTVAQGQNNTLIQDARLFALLNVALADAGICAWDMKRDYGLWRPITAIQQANTDGNPNTIADPNWEPLLSTPPFPTYVSGHSTFGAAAAVILKDFFGQDIPFTATSDDLPGVERFFSTFWDAAEENGESRIYGGIHFDFDNLVGLTAGAQVGDMVFANFLEPVPLPGTLSLVSLLLPGMLLWRNRRRTN